jgi:tetratricopeptide (TPR) repeat protein
VFVIPVPINEARYVQRIELGAAPDNRVYHADIRLDHTSRSRQLDMIDPDPGYDGRLARTAEYPDGQFVSWSLGGAPADDPRGTAWRIEPGTDLVLRLHMRHADKPVTVQPSVALTFRDAEPDPTVMVRLGRRDIDIEPGAADYTTTDSFVLPVDVQLQALQPHAHDYTRRLEAEARLPDGTVKRLLQIKRWESRWQRAYHYETPIALPRGTTIVTRYSFGNPSRPGEGAGRPPAHVRFGPGIGDAIGDLWLQLVAATDEDHAALERATDAKMLADDIAGYETLVETLPLDPSLYDDLAYLCLEAGRTDDAAAYLTSSLELNPRSAAAHTRLGTVMLQRDQVSEAVQHFEEALRIDARHAEAHYQMGSVNWLRGENQAAATRFARALALAPNYPRALMDLSWIRSSAAEVILRNPAEALRLASRAVELTRGVDPAALDALAAAQAASGKFELAVETTERALKFDMPELLAEAIRSRHDIYRQGLAYVVLDPR